MSVTDPVREDPRSWGQKRSRAITPQGPGSISTASRLAERTLSDRVARDHSVTTVLVVDDIRETRDYISKLLSLETDIEVVGVAATGIEAIEVAHRLGPEIILMDIMMPEMNGLTATELLLDRMPEVAVVMMSIQGEGDYVSRAFRAGARGYLVKPFSSDELLAAVREARTTPKPRLRGYGTERRPDEAV